MKTITLLSAVTLLLASWSVFAGGQGAVLTEAWTAMETDSAVQVDDKWDYIRFLPVQSTARKSVCFAFYPGGFISPYAYAPYTRALAEAGYISFILKVPLGFALLEPDAADDAKKDRYAQTHCSAFVAGGHSVGGVAAVEYIVNHPDDGLVLLASYPQDTTSIAANATIVSSIYGTNDCQTSVQDINNSTDNLPASTTYVEISGGNHPQFGWYTDSTTGECAATISHRNQAEIFINETLRVLGLFE
ncbi:alpha/beta hydrolase [Rheinheimera sp.]|uniref:alpha/beta hydrolase n=1 Tax=Rheinheimera sp. TaxID=1869214 RepID=UPI00307D5099